MSNAPKYRKKAVEYEQLKQFDRAVASYVRAIEENENAGEEVDVALFNKVGDLTLRQGRVTEAVTYYERAVEHYVSNSLFDNAIALCNKILRNAPGRSNVYFTLGRICGRKGLRSDATRNFLEYATRMQQEGRVDEGMRALAEVADLMPELTEVRRLVEEHAARAGISLTRRRETPTRAPVQPESEQVRSFGLSKDLVFLEIDYDAVRANREKTPPPQPLIAVETAKASEAAAATPIAKAAQTPSARLEDLMIFDPRNTGNGPAPVDDFDSTIVVDGASILKPYVDPATPVVSLPDLEPTELSATPVFTEVATDAQTISTGPNSAIEAPVVAFREEPQPVTTVVSQTPPTVAEFPAHPTEETVALDGVQSGISSQLFSELPNEETLSNEQVDASINAELSVESQSEPAEHTESVTELPFIVTPTPVASFVEPSAQIVDESFETVAEVANDISTEVEFELPATFESDVVIDVVIDAVADVGAEAEFEIPDFVAADVVEGVAVESVEIVVADVDDSVFESLPVESLVEISDAETDQDWVTPDLGNITDEQAFNEILPAPALEGFTADEEPLIVAELPLLEPIDELIVLDVVADVELHAEADVLPSLDFDAMLDLSSSEIEPVADFEAEEFTALNDEFAAPQFVHLDEPTEDVLVDAFESDDELPPLIFPLAAENKPSDADVLDFVDNTPLSTAIEASRVEVVDIVDVPSMDVVDDSALDVIDNAALDFVDVTPISVVPANVELVFLDVAAEESVALTPIALTPIALTPIALEIVEPEIGEDNLDDLFGDTGIPTAVAAAEATLVASSRRAELQSASDADPKNFILRRRLGEALLEAGNRDAAINELGAALAGAELAGALSDAADIADELVRVASDEIAHHQKRLELAIRLGDQSRLRDAYLDLADNLVRRGEDLRAKAVYARVLEMDPWDERARTALGDAAPPPPVQAVMAGGSDDGHVSLADWLRDDDEPVSTRLRMREPDVSGDEQDDFNALLKHFKEGVARSLGEDDYESHYDLGVAYKEMGLLDDAIGEFQMALRSRNNRLAAYEALGQCFLEQQSYKVAITVLSRALHEPAIQDEQRVGILYLLGYSCEVLQRFDEARSYFQRVYATDIHFRDVGQRLADLERTVR